MHKSGVNQFPIVGTKSAQSKAETTLQPHSSSDAKLVFPHYLHLIRNSAVERVTERKGWSISFFFSFFLLILFPGHIILFTSWSKMKASRAVKLAYQMPPPAKRRTLNMLIDRRLRYVARGAATCTHIYMHSHVRTHAYTQAETFYSASGEDKIIIQ